MNKHPLLLGSRMDNAQRVTTAGRQSDADFAESAHEEDQARANVALEVIGMPNRRSGFTLIELMITVAVAAILAGVAYPAYTRYITRSHRVEAKSGLVEIAAAQERFYLGNNKYSSTVSDVYKGPSTYFDFATTGDATTYSVTATAKSTQLNDVACKTFTITSAGAKTAKKKDGTTANDTECWR